MAKKTAAKAVEESVTAQAAGLDLSPEEIAAIIEFRKNKAESLTHSSGGGERSVAISDLAQALITAIETTRPPSKKTPFTRVKKNPYFPTDGSPRAALKRPVFQHGIELNTDHLYNKDIEGLNKVKPGAYCGGWIRVMKRRDGGLDISYPVRTVAQRLKLSNFGITDFSKLVERLLDERANPAQYRRADDDDDD